MQPFSPRWLIPFALVVLLLPSCGDTADDSADTTLPPAEILPATDGPIEWRWDSESGSKVEVPGVPRPIMGWNCYGFEGYQVSSATVEYGGGSIDFEMGNMSTPDIVVTDGAGAVTEVGNPFGADAWLCGVGASGEMLLAVGSGVFWSTDGITWSAIDAFEEYARSEEFYSGLLWAAAGSEGYIVFGQTLDDSAEGLAWGSKDVRRLAWFSEDLASWYVIPVEDPEDVLAWGLLGLGPTGVAVDTEPIIITFDGAWIGNRP